MPPSDEWIDIDMVNRTALVDELLIRVRGGRAALPNEAPRKP
jgi:hypothetical protein